MKRLWLGLTLLLSLLGLCVLISVRAAVLCLPAAQWAEEASRACIAGEPARAQVCLEQAHGIWTSHRQQIALWADHTPMEQAELLWQQAGAFLRSDEPGEAASVCAALAGLLRSICDAQQLSWQNLL